MAEKHDKSMCPVCSPKGRKFKHLDECKERFALSYITKARTEILMVARQLEEAGGDLGGLIGVIEESLK